MEAEESLSDRQEYEVEALKAIYDKDFEVGHSLTVIGLRLHMVVVQFLRLHSCCSEVNGGSLSVFVEDYDI